MIVLKWWVSWSDSRSESWLTISHKCDLSSSSKSHASCSLWLLYTIYLLLFSQVINIMNVCTKFRGVSCWDISIWSIHSASANEKTTNICRFHLLEFVDVLLFSWQNIKLQIFANRFLSCLQFADSKQSELTSQTCLMCVHIDQLSCCLIAERLPKVTKCRRLSNVNRTRSEISF